MNKHLTNYDDNSQNSPIKKLLRLEPYSLLLFINSKLTSF